VTGILLASAWSDFASRHWVILGIATSLLWWWTGRPPEFDKNVNSAIAWQCVAVIFTLVLCVRMAMENEWLGFACALAVLYLEIRSIRRLSSFQDRQG
jgi:hypothetical protein